ncbi:MAG TPA: hypothetical protein PK796_10420 [Bacteroidales bacterium]|jgi:hypothetical protein|nr:hypothetical protein [Bacteroidales bacterium]
MADTPAQPTPNNGPNTQTKKPVNKIFRKLKRILYWFIFIFLLFIAAFVYWKYFFTYSDGYRAGLLQKFSRKGTIFKTYEGEIILSSVQSNKDVVLASEKFLFSVKDTKIVNQLDSIQGRFIVIHYEEKNGTLPWRGDSRYLVDSVRVER